MADVNITIGAALDQCEIADKVLVEMTPYDLTKERIIYRSK